MWHVTLSFKLSTFSRKIIYYSYIFCLYFSIFHLKYIFACVNAFHFSSQVNLIDFLFSLLHNKLPYGTPFFRILLRNDCAFHAQKKNIVWNGWWVYCLLLWFHSSFKDVEGEPEQLVLCHLFCYFFKISILFFYFLILIVLLLLLLRKVVVLNCMNIVV